MFHLMIALQSTAVERADAITEQRLLRDNIITQMQSEDMWVKVRVKSHLLYDTTRGFLYSHQTFSSVTPPQRSQTHTHCETLYEHQALLVIQHF